MDMLVIRLTSKFGLSVSREKEDWCTEDLIMVWEAEDFWQSNSLTSFGKANPRAQKTIT